MTTICPACNQEVAIDSYCGKCREPLTQPKDGNHLKQKIKGHHNNGIQMGGDNNGTIIINPTSPVQEQTPIRRSSIKPISILGKHVKNWWLLVSGGLTLAANIATVIGTFSAFASGEASSSLAPSPFLLWLLIFNAPFILLSGFLLTKKVVTLPLINKTIEKDKDGFLYITNITGTCGICKSSIRVKTIGPEDSRKTVIACTNEPELHQWPFDRTKMPDVGDNYRNSL